MPFICVFLFLPVEVAAAAAAAALGLEHMDASERSHMTKLRRVWEAGEEHGAFSSE